MTGRPIVPFPVVAPYRVRPDLHRLEPGGVAADVDPGPLTVFRCDATWPDVRAERLAALERHAEDVRAVDDAEQGGALLHAAGLALARAVAAEWPQRVRVDGEAVVLPTLGVRVEPDGALAPTEAPPEGDGARRTVLVLAERPAALRRLEGLASSLHEDLVLIGPGSGCGRVAWLHVAFPSGWDPGAMAGASFERLHAPVPHAEGLRRAAPALVRAMIDKGPFVRYVWGVAPDGARSRHPRHAAAMTADAPIDGAYLRVERQTTLPLPVLGLAVFAIHVYATPLPLALAAPVRRAAFLAAVRSLDPLTRRYKGVPWSDDALAAWAAQLPDGPRAARAATP
jgi:hypothetical protein